MSDFAIVCLLPLSHKPRQILTFISSTVVVEEETTTEGGGGLGSLILPLAALTLLGGTGAVLLASALLPALGIGRKKRDADPMEGDLVARKNLDEMEILEQFWTHQPQAKDQADKMLAQYIDCSGVFDGDREHKCLERLSCMNGNKEGRYSEQERKVLSM